MAQNVLLASAIWVSYHTPKIKANVIIEPPQKCGYNKETADPKLDWLKVLHSNQPNPKARMFKCNNAVTLTFYEVPNQTKPYYRHNGQV